MQMVVDVDTVHVHSNIVKLEKDSQGNPVDDLYQYEEIQYDKDEYIHKMSEKSRKEHYQYYVSIV